MFSSKWSPPQDDVDKAVQQQEREAPAMEGDMGDDKDDDKKETTNSGEKLPPPRDWDSRKSEDPKQKDYR
ncbi:hypothetical protein [Rhizobium sp. MHM7A]|uniref:hypothetical protein n=1 Tax=Rhizobium sp. MHM7A TaxID=2583233 RepID=UPI0011064FC6|nr:hypothetical protein [Rhizobium sp. MHM7A]TLX12294.1 hypothetical protein FFR93_17235 [Rhizobium sp. MHM7A]